MPTRFRTRQKGFLPGGVAKATNVAVNDIIQAPSYDLYEEMTDFVGNPHGDNPLTLIQRSPVTGFIDGRTSAYYDCTGYHVFDQTSNLIVSAASSSPPSDNVSFTTLLARTSPSRSVVNLPVFWSELRDLPKLVQLAGNTILKRGASSLLSWEFGWKPLFSDIRKMVNFQAHVNERVQELKNLYDGDGLHRSFTVWEDISARKVRQMYVGPTYSNPTLLSISYATIRRKWVCTCYHPTSIPDVNTDDAMLEVAMKAIFGLDITPHTLWEAMPWSWMIDWFSNIGDYLGTHRNTVPAEATRLCVMNSVRSRPIDFYWVNNPYGAKFRIYENAGRHEKYRSPYTSPLLPEFNLPFLSGRQLSILSSLAVLRLK